jgi:UDP-3-O-[3-hydroxymyristoyl] glucosamine N-acyltransferase
MQRSLSRRTAAAGFAAAAILGLADAGIHAQRGARASVSRGASVNRSASVDRSANVNRSASVDRSANVNRNTNINRNVNVDRDVDVNIDRRYGGSGYGCCYNPVGRAAVATAAAVTTAAVVGSMVHTLPPSCQSVSVNGFTYQQCGSTWYQPQFQGSSVTYVVINPPR